MNEKSKLFLEKCIKRHNHQILWQAGSSVILEINSITGLIPKLKGVDKFFTKTCFAEVFPFDQKVIFRGVGEYREITYCKGNIKFQDKDHLNSLCHRSNFYGSNKMRFWSIEDTLYFFGYALVTYFSVPSLIKDLKIVHAGEVGDLFMFKVHFPEGFDTHCQTQSFYFDKSGLLFRHDYTADIISIFSTGSHFTTEYIDKNGVLVAKRRKVKLRLGKWVTPFEVLEASIS